MTVEGSRFGADTKTFPCGHIGVQSTDGQLVYCRRCRADGKEGFCEGHGRGNNGVKSNMLTGEHWCMSCERPLRGRSQQHLKEPATINEITAVLGALERIVETFTKFPTIAPYMWPHPIPSISKTNAVIYELREKLKTMQQKASSTPESGI